MANVNIFKNYNGSNNYSVGDNVSSNTKNITKTHTLDTMDVSDTSSNNSYANYTSSNADELDLSLDDKETSFNSNTNASNLSSSLDTQLSRLNEMDDLLGSAIDDIENEIETLENSSISSFGPWDKPSATSNSNASQNNDEKISELKDELAQLKYLRGQIQNEIKLAPYKDKLESSEFKKFVETYDPDGWGFYSDDFIACGYDVNLYYLNHSMGAGGANDPYAINNLDELDQYAMFEFYVKMCGDKLNMDGLIAVGNVNLMNGLNKNGKPYSNPAENYFFMTEDERNMYHYLFANEGKEAAESYIDLIQDEINMREGAYYAEQFIQTLDLNNPDIARETVADHFRTSSKGLMDGIENFFVGIDNIIVADERLTASDYEKAYILQYLEQNSDLLDENYEFSQSLGNMVPAMTAGVKYSFHASSDSPYRS